MDKKKIVYVLSTGCTYLKQGLNEKTITKNSAWNDYWNLHDLLYGEGRTLLAISNAVKFEKSLNSIKNKIEKLEGAKK